MLLLFTHIMVSLPTGNYFCDAFNMIYQSLLWDNLIDHIMQPAAAVVED